MRRAPILRLLGFAAFVVGAGAFLLARQDAPPLGPKDGQGLPPTDTGRVAVGEPAPDFTLEPYAGGRITLSQFRGKKNIVLVFYRGHW